MEIGLGGEMSLILSVDIGGTNCRLAAFSLNQGRLYLDQKIWLKTADLTTTADFLQACQDFIPHPKAMVVAVAGPIQATGAKVTNAALELDLISLQTHFPQVQIINDFVAQAWAVLTQPGQQAGLIKAGAAAQSNAQNAEQDLKGHLTHANLGILGAGTGLGAASLYSRQGQWQAIASELGHTLFPFIGSEELELQKFCRAKLETWQINYDDILTGRGLSLVHEFLSGQILTAAEIGDNFLSQASSSLSCGSNPNSSSASRPSLNPNSGSASSPTLDWFARFYARVCRTWIMNTLCTDGLYLAGGIAAKNPDLVQCASFREELMASKTNGQLISQTPIWLMTNPDSGLWGAAYVATKIAEES